MCVAFSGSADDRVRLVVITKDVRSLFFVVDVKGAGSGLSNFMIDPQELHHKLALELNVDADALGARDEIPACRWVFSFDGHAPRRASAQPSASRAR